MSGGSQPPGGKIGVMSGHSKWATIHRAKEAKDAKKGAAFTKLAMNITVAVRQGGGIGDPDQNFRLRLAVDKARQFNMPKENINRAIEKGVGNGGADSLTEALYEGFAPGGVAVMAEALTDNKVRTAQFVRLIIEKNGGVMGNSGSVNYMFSHLGELKIPQKDSKNGDLDSQELDIIDCGVDDIEVGDGFFLAYCNKDLTYEVKKAVEAKGFLVESAELIMKPQALVEVSDTETAAKVEKILEELENLDDVQKVWTNYA